MSLESPALQADSLLLRQLHEKEFIKKTGSSLHLSKEAAIRNGSLWNTKLNRHMHQSYLWWEVMEEIDHRPSKVEQSSSIFISKHWYLARHWFPHSIHHSPPRRHHSTIDSSPIFKKNFFHIVFYCPAPKEWLVPEHLICNSQGRCLWWGLHREDPTERCVCAKLLQSCPNLWSCSPPGSSVHGILQVRIPEWVAVPSSRGSSWPRDQTWVSYVSCIGRQVLYH